MLCAPPFTAVCIISPYRSCPGLFVVSPPDPAFAAGSQPVGCIFCGLTKEKRGVPPALVLCAHVLVNGKRWYCEKKRERGGKMCEVRCDVRGGVEGIYIYTYIYIYVISASASARTFLIHGMARGEDRWYQILKNCRSIPPPFLRSFSLLYQHDETKTKKPRIGSIIHHHLLYHPSPKSGNLVF